MLRPPQYLGCVKQIIQRILKPFGLELRRTRFDPDLMAFIRERAIDTVLDVGANIGQFGTQLRAKGYRGRIVSFEPISEVYKTLAAKATSDRDWTTNNYALGAKSEQATIHVSDMSVFSSILPSTSAATRFDDAAAVARTETIEVRTLDDACRGVSGNVLLKIDTQGFERQVLQGGRSMLSIMKGILMELPIVHLYEGTWRLHEAIEFMADAGFVPAQIHRVNFHSTDPVSLLEVDCLFRPRDPRLD
jgi:FkbM family methyltransferase